MSNASVPARQVVLVVLDGWGYRPEREGNAIELARTPIWHRLWESEPRTLLDASGLAVGLPAGQMGYSEVGHLNLGAEHDPAAHRPDPRPELDVLNLRLRVVPLVVHPRLGEHLAAIPDNPAGRAGEED